MTSKEIHDLSRDWLVASISDRDVAIAQVYATLAVAAAQREYNEMKVGAFIDERIPKG